MAADPAAELESLAAAGLRRVLRPLQSPAGPVVTRDGRELHNFASNDYLGLACHQALAEAFIEGVKRYGAGAAAARLVSGTLPPHAALEEDLAAAKGTGAALVFSSGFATAIGCLPAIVGAGDTVVLDKLCHASLIDAAKLSGATLRVFPHNDTAKLRKLLGTLRAKDASGRILVVTESVFSMDGDLCPLLELLDAVEEHDALLWLDEAHAFGVLGDRGMGLAEALGCQHRVAFQMGTFSKAAGLSGGYVAASRVWIDLLVNRARAFIYSTAPPPALAHATRESLRLIQSEDGSQLRERLKENVRLLSADASSAILPVVLGTNEAALEGSRRLEAEGFMVPAIRYPTVPRGSARLRVSVSAAHESSSIEKLRSLLPV
ncbi:8-amino-7-oxononanoate synthase [Luteolibacter sp. LG18]|uniref:aminotransferase class I/II-fold pyridoxal phosphate-dependent enzyme n=1 Tax=Luteolibacter sp. LG18 TaxID=2819286 RepID=UPI002B2C4EC8|nr:8-amino-7-oxononanoate synthase [Luteolibacter sp. LG18]